MPAVFLQALPDVRTWFPHKSAQSQPAKTTILAAWCALDFAGISALGLLSFCC
jgi:hypothetical protein